MTLLLGQRLKQFRLALHQLGHDTINLSPARPREFDMEDTSVALIARPPNEPLPLGPIKPLADRASTHERGLLELARSETVGLAGTPQRRQ